MTEITRDTVTKVASLAKLKLTEDEVSHYQVQLSRILGYFAKMDEFHDGLGAEWRSDVIGSPTPERDDRAEASATTEEALAQAPKRSGSSFEVPRIIE